MRLTYYQHSTYYIVCYELYRTPSHILFRIIQDQDYAAFSISLTTTRR